jgi:shikimate dehydrogenase
MPDRYAVLGNPVAHSLSPRIHALFAAQTGEDMVYESILAPRDGFAATVRRFIAAGGRGANVTLPFKEEACRLADRLSPRAAAAGAVNTLAFDDAGIAGDNTDGAGLVRDLTANLACSVAGRRILLLGAGGAARGVLRPLLDLAPAELFIANRGGARAADLARQFAGAGGGGFDELRERSFDLVINATSAGLADAALPIPDSVFAADGLAYDMLYGRETPFLAQARRAGARVADGLGMLVEQAAEAFLVWRGTRPETASVLGELRRG